MGAGCQVDVNHWGETVRSTVAGSPAWIRTPLHRQRECYGPPFSISLPLAGLLRAYLVLISPDRRLGVYWPEVRTQDEDPGRRGATYAVCSKLLDCRCTDVFCRTLASAGGSALRRGNRSDGGGAARRNHHGHPNSTEYLGQHQVGCRWPLPLSSLEFG